MKKSGAIVAAIPLLLATFAFAVPGVLADSPTPPKDLKLVGDHWTAWDPPEAGPGAYVIVKGDTLWDLAEEWLGDPFLWPQIWDENRYVLDSHWIYPGDPLVVPGRPAVVGDDEPPVADNAGGAGGQGDAGDTGGGDQTGTPVMAKPLVPVATAADVYCARYIDPEHQHSDVWVAGLEEEHREIIGQSDVIFLSKGRNFGIQPGDEFAVIRAGDEVAHPDSGQSLGRAVKRLGKVRVMLVQDNTATAVVQFACEDVRGSDEIVPWQDIPVPMFSELPPFDRYDTDPSGGTTGAVVATADDSWHVGEGQIIQTDLGAASGVAPGEFVTLFRNREELPRVMIGQAVILTVEPLTSTALITSSVRESSVGDRVETLR